MPGPRTSYRCNGFTTAWQAACRSAPIPRVLVSGQPVATIAAPYAVAGCAFVPPGGNGPV